MALVSEALPETASVGLRMALTTVRLAGASRLAVTPSFIGVYLWSSAESLHYYGRMRRRQRVGLADAVVTNRFFVWGFGSAAGASVLAGLLANSLVAGSEAVASALISASGLVSTLTGWLAFAPPSAYRRWLTGRSKPARA